MHKLQGKPFHLFYGRTFQCVLLQCVDESAATGAARSVSCCSIFTRCLVGSCGCTLSRLTHPISCRWVGEEVGECHDFKKNIGSQGTCLNFTHVSEKKHTFLMMLPNCVRQNRMCSSKMRQIRRKLDTFNGVHLRVTCTCYRCDKKGFVCVGMKGAVHRGFQCFSSAVGNVLF